jgi:molybdopterin-guanine dinucleotide biosynthesis protein A
LNPINAVILAGGLLPSDDPLFGIAPYGRRSLVDVHGKPMVQWVVDALSQSNSIGTLYIMGLNEQAGLKSEKPCVYLPDDGGVFENIHAGVIRSAQDYPDREKVILASADIPALTCEMVDWLVGQVKENPEKQLYYNIIPRPVMETQFPTSARSYIHFKDMAVCGGDLNAVDVTLFSKERSIWKSLAKARKHPLQQASLLGLDTLLLVLLRAITLEGAVKKVCSKLDITGMGLVCPFAEMGMDADKPHQLAILRENLAEQA